jgi:hypothetical protein
MVPLLTIGKPVFSLLPLILVITACCTATLHDHRAGAATAQTQSRVSPTCQVTIDAIIFRGRRQDAVPLVTVAEELS